jgi:hypothetical protein
MGLLLGQPVCAVRDADLLLGLGGSFLTNIFDQFRLGMTNSPPGA